MAFSPLVLLSGGLDSVFAFHKAREECGAASALTFDYGQTAAAREIAAAKKLCAKFGVTHETVSLDFLKNLPGHPLFDANARCPEPEPERLDAPEAARRTAKAVWVPNRNGVFLNVAAALAEARGLNRLYVGFNAEEAATFPDNSPAFVAAANAALSFSTANGVTLVAPAAGLRKTAIVAELKRRDFDFDPIWSCYRGGERMCGRCESCLRLARALSENGLGETAARIFDEIRINF